MAINIVRYEDDGRARWGVVRSEGVAPLEGDYPTTAALIVNGAADWRAAAAAAPPLALSDLRLLAPVTTPCRIFCQGANYRQHMIESGLDPDEKTFNMFFTKSDASIAPAVGCTKRPSHVALLDYEIELALIFGHTIDAPVTVTAADLPRYVFAIAVANDLSARDVQLPQTQFFKGKSYCGFLPIGPWLTVLDPDDFAAIDRLDLHLAVNGETRQRDSVVNLVFKPAETISELSTFANVSPGDVLLTGTPSGCALRVPPPAVRRIMQLLPERRFWSLFRTSQSKRREYLQEGDRIEASIRTADARIDLGLQHTLIE